MTIAFVNATNASKPGSSGNISVMTHTGVVAHATLPFADTNLVSGDTVAVSGVSPANYVGNFDITVIDSTHFDYTMAVDPGANGTGSPVMAYKVSLRVPKPFGTSDGDGLVLFVDPLGGKAALTPTGWTHRQDSPYVGTTGKVVQCFTKIASSEPANTQVYFSGTTLVGIDLMAIMLTYSGVDNASMYDVGSGTATASSLAPVANSITTANANEMLVACFLYFNSDTYAVPGGMANRNGFHGGTSPFWGMFACDQLQAAAGASGNKTATLNVASAAEAVMIALKPGAPTIITQWFLAC